MFSSTFFTHRATQRRKKKSKKKNRQKPAKLLLGGSDSLASASRTRREPLAVREPSADSPAVSTPGRWNIVCGDWWARARQRASQGGRPKRAQTPCLQRTILSGSSPQTRCPHYIFLLPPRLLHAASSHFFSPPSLLLMVTAAFPCLPVSPKAPARRTQCDKCNCHVVDSSCCFVCRPAGSCKRSPRTNNKCEKWREQPCKYIANSFLKVVPHTLG